MGNNLSHHWPKGKLGRKKYSEDCPPRGIFPKVHKGLLLHSHLEYL